MVRVRHTGMPLLVAGGALRMVFGPSDMYLPHRIHVLLYISFAPAVHQYQIKLAVNTTLIRSGAKQVDHLQPRNCTQLITHHPYMCNMHVEKNSGHVDHVDNGGNTRFISLDCNPTKMDVLSGRHKRGCYMPIIYMPNKLCIQFCVGNDWRKSKS